jgi:ubiquinone/menaquinone biosynthesis C-methylase UbiE
VVDLLLRTLFPKDRHHVAGLHDRIRSVIPECGRILDLGCGANGDLAPYRSDDLEVWGTDFDRHSHLQHEQWFRTLSNTGQIPFADGEFDMVVAVMVLEHIQNPQTFLAEVNRVLKPNGVFIGHTISGHHPVTLIRRVLGILPHSLNQWLVKALYGREPEDTFPAYYRMNSHRALTRAAIASNFASPSIDRYTDPGYFRFSKVVQAMAVIVDRIGECIAPGCGRLYLTAMLRKSERSSTRDDMHHCPTR